MAKNTESVVVTQAMNPKYDSGKPEHYETNAELLYVVKKTVNTLTVKIGQRLNPKQVESLIELGINVTVQGD